MLIALDSRPGWQLGLPPWSSPVKSSYDFHRFPDGERITRERLRCRPARGRHRSRPLRRLTLENASRQAIEEAKALDPDERCIDHRRIRRLSNGWEQNGIC